MLPSSLSSPTSEVVSIRFGRRWLIHIACFVMAGLPFLVGYGVTPQTNLTAEALSLVGLALALVFLAQGMLQGVGRWPLGVGWPDESGRWYLTQPLALVLLVLLTLAVSVVVQALVYAVPGKADAYLTVLGYWLATALAVLLGHMATDARSTEAGLWLQAMASATLLAALMAAAASAAQYFDQPAYWAMLSPVADAGRTYGFVRQPNQQSSFLNLGLVALLALVAWRQVRVWLALPAAAVLVFAMVTTGSRTGLLQLTLLVGLLLVVPLGGRTGRGRWVWPLLLLALGAAIWSALYLASQSGLGAFYGAQKLQQTTSEGMGLRLGMWRETLQLIAAHPWVGSGVMHFHGLFFLSGAAAKLGVLMSHSHNLPLQLAFDYGVPLALLVLAVLGWVMWRARGQLRTPCGFLALASLGVVLLHSMLEFPLWYTYFLLPFGFWLGTITHTAAFGSVAADSTLPDVAQIAASSQPEVAEPLGRQRWVAAALLVLGLIALAVPVWMNRDFFKLTPAYMGRPSPDLVRHLREDNPTFWFQRFAQFPAVVNEKTTSDNSQLVMLQSARLGCQMAEPVFQHNYVLALWQQGRREEALSIVYSVWTLNKKTLENFKRSLAESAVSDKEVLMAYVNKPTPVPARYETFKQICMNRSATAAR